MYTTPTVSHEFGSQSITASSLPKSPHLCHSVRHEKKKELHAQSMTSKGTSVFSFQKIEKRPLWGSLEKSETRTKIDTTQTPSISESRSGGAITAKLYAAPWFREQYPLCFHLGAAASSSASWKPTVQAHLHVRETFPECLAPGEPSPGDSLLRMYNPRAIRNAASKSSIAHPGFH